MILSSPDVHLIYINGVKFIAKEMKKALRETKTQTLHAGCSKAEPKKFCPAVDPLPGGAERPKFNQLEIKTGGYWWRRCF